jgi:hypothetical protein
MSQSTRTFRSSLLTWLALALQLGLFSFLLVVLVIASVEHAPMTHRVALSRLDALIGIPLAFLFMLAGLLFIERRVALFVVGDDAGLVIWRRSGRMYIPRERILTAQERQAFNLRYGQLEFTDRDGEQRSIYVFLSQGSQNAFQNYSPKCPPQG